MQKYKSFLLVFICFLWVNNVLAKDIKLITIGAGDEFWSAFGHTALSVDNQVYGFGYFSFEDENLIQSFISNQMLYDLGVSDLSREIELAEWQNRTFIIQDLSLSATEKAEIVKYLYWHNLPENQSYQYDYFLNNCSTKIRDIINSAWDGLLKSTHDSGSNGSYFEQTFPAKHQSLMNLGLALAYGWSAYTPRTDWELMAFPAYLQAKITEMAPVKDTNPKVIYEEVKEGRVIYEFKTHWLLVLIFLMFFALLFFNSTRRAAQISLWIMQSTIGCVLLILWLFSGHDVIAWNFNVLLFVPWAVLIVKFKKLQWLMLACYMAWLVLAVMLAAWYLIPFWVLHTMAVIVQPKRS